MYDTLAQWVEFQTLEIFGNEPFEPSEPIYIFNDGGLYCVMENILIVRCENKTYNFNMNQVFLFEAVDAVDSEDGEILGNNDNVMCVKH